MKEDLTFRIIFGIQIALIMMFNRLLPALRAKRSGVKLAPDQQAIENEGKFWFAFRVIAGILLAAVIVIYAFIPKINAWLQLPVPNSLRWIGVVIASIGLLFWIYSQAVLDKNWSANLKIQKAHALITSGPYSVMRHPIYSAMIFWSVGLALFTANVFFAVFTVAVIVWTPPRIAKEEKLMINHFGDQYLNYMQTTGRYFPKFTRKS